MLATSARLLRLLGHLQARRDWSAADLAERLGVTTRTVRRDVDRLRLLGYPVEARPGVHGGYRLGVGGTLPPLLLDDDEAVAVAVGLRGAAHSGLTGIDEVALRALAKLEQLLPGRLRRRVRGLSAAIVPMVPDVDGLDVDTLLTVTSAVRDSVQLRAGYVRADGTESSRTLEPHRVVQAGRRWYLVAWDVGRGDWRTFRLDRLRPSTVPGRRFTPRAAPDPDIAGWTSHGVSTAVYRHRCRATVHAPAAVVAERIGPTVGVVTPLDGASCRLEVGSDSLDELVLYLGLLDAEVTVHEPAELRARMADVGARLVRAAAGG